MSSNQIDSLETFADSAKKRFFDIFFFIYLFISITITFLKLIQEDIGLIEAYHNKVSHNCNKRH